MNRRRPCMSMIRINEHYRKLKASYLFSDIAKRVNAFTSANPETPVIRMGIGDVTEPLPAVCRAAFTKAVNEMGDRKTFRGYGPEQGYPFLREAIAEHAYKNRGCEIAPDEVFVSDGSKCDSANIQEIFSADCRVAIPDPVYPVYLDTNVMAGRTGHYADGRYADVVYLDCTPGNRYLPALPEKPVDLIYLCFPNNPTGATATRDDLKHWVRHARENKALILFDAAYEGFVQNPAIPRSIFEIEGARECAIEFRSFSKNAGFTGIRCAYTVVPKELHGIDAHGDEVSLHSLWNRRHTTKFNGVAYPVQRAAAAVFSEEGKRETTRLIAHYMKNARLLREALVSWGFECVGGDNAPYIWIQVGGGSWAFFDRLLNEAGVICTPGAGFGTCGEGHVRLSAFNSSENVEKAIERMRPVFAG